MGCDIHAHVELKINGVWRHWSARNMARDYWLFGRMAGVRGDGPAIAEPRGIPEDSTFETKFEYDHWYGDAHSASWLTAKETYDLGREYNAKYRGSGNYIYWEQQTGYIFGNGWHLEGMPAGVEDARLIYWFDN